MKIIILSLIPCLSLSQDNIDGEWIKEGKGYKYTLKINHLDSNAYEFELEGWERAYDNFINDTTTFPGEIKGDGYIFYREDDIGLFNDAGRLFDGEDFYYGEEPCKIFFMIKQNYIKLASMDCGGWYGGYGINWNGKYLKTNENENGQ